MQVARTAYAEVEVWCEDEHRLGLKPITGRTWAPRGERPIARVEHRFEWLYLYAFACPAQGQAHFWLLPEVNTVAFSRVLEAFAKDTGAGSNKAVLLVLDGAGYHTAHDLEVPEGITLVFLPPHAPELQPAEHLWTLTDEPLKNKHFSSLKHLQDTLEPHLAALETQTQTLQDHTHFHWWPEPKLIL